MIGVTIITGFLGSGKTTLLKNLLHESVKKKKRIAIIHNEFTDENNNIDKIVFKDINDIYNFPKEYEQNEQLGENGKENEKNVEELKIVKEIENTNGFIYELNNGCLCCSNKSNFVKLIENILSMKESYDFIFVEVSGVYDNIQVNNLMWLDELNKSNIYLDSIVHIIDSYIFMKTCSELKNEENSEEHGAKINENSKLQEEETLTYKQISVCDVLLINKKDKVKEEDIEKLKIFMKNLNPLAFTFLTSYAKIDIEKITNLRCYEKKNVKTFLKNFNGNNCFRYNQFNNCSLRFELNIHALIEISEKLKEMKKLFLKERNKNILKKIFYLKKVGIFSFRKINETLASFLWNNELKVFRGKGIFIAFNDDIYNNKKKLELNIYYYQSVGDVYEINLALTDVHVFFKDMLIDEHINTDSFHMCDKVKCSKTDHSNILENSNEIYSIPHDCEHIDTNEFTSVNIYDNFLDSEYCSDDSSSSENEEYNLSNVLNCKHTFTSKFLFIGKEIDENQIRKMLNGCFCDLES